MSNGHTYIMPIVRAQDVLSFFYVSLKIDTTALPLSINPTSFHESNHPQLLFERYLVFGSFGTVRDVSQACLAKICKEKSVWPTKEILKAADLIPMQRLHRLIDRQ